MHLQIYADLVGGLEHFLFSHILGIIIPIDYYFSEGFKPPTSDCFQQFHPIYGIYGQVLMS